jgi:hypothetical protein
MMPQAPILPYLEEPPDKQAGHPPATRLMKNPSLENLVNKDGFFISGRIFLQIS